MSRQNRKLREQFERKVSEILARPLADLQSRGWLPPALGGFSSPPISREAQAERMREVLERDRAMAEANPAQTASSAAHEVEEPKPSSAHALPSNVEVTSETEPTHEPQEPAVDAADATPIETSPPPSSRAPRKRKSCSEPIRTRTMAKLLLSQGHPQRALSIYETLIAEGANDPVLLAEADALRSLQN